MPSPLPSGACEVVAIPARTRAWGSAAAGAATNMYLGTGTVGIFTQKTCGMVVAVELIGAVPQFCIN